MSSTEFMSYRSRSRDQQDAFERHVWGQRRYTAGAGSVIDVRGTDTLDEDAPVLNTGYGFNLPENSDAEVFLVALGSDTNQKVAMLTLPRSAQREWPEGAGGVQHPTDPDVFIQLNDEGVEINHSGGSVITMDADGNVTISASSIVVVADDTVFNSDVVVNGTLDANGSALRHNGTNVGDSHRHGGVDTGPSSTQGPF